MKRILSVVLLGLLTMPVAWAYPAGESGGGGTPDGMTACPVEGKIDPHSAFSRLATEHGQLQTRYPMTPVASCGQPAPGLQAQIPMGLICRWGPYFCYLIEPLPVGTSCCCDAGFCGAVTTQ